MTENTMTFVVPMYNNNLRQQVLRDPSGKADPKLIPEPKSVTSFIIGRTRVVIHENSSACM